VDAVFAAAVASKFIKLSDAVAGHHLPHTPGLRTPHIALASYRNAAAANAKRAPAEADALEGLMVPRAYTLEARAPR
jgi:hypothetical protein